jgi:hypothetical protein
MGPGVFVGTLQFILVKHATAQPYGLFKYDRTDVDG